MMPHQVNVPLPDGAGMFVTLSIQNDGTATPEAMDATLMSLVDHLQAWPDKRPDGNVQGIKYETRMYEAQPTDPEPPAAGPEPEPPSPEMP
jgi:hypothetical protein